MSKEIKVIIKHPGQDPFEATIDNTLESCQAVVGGYIECVTLTSDICLVCNEEGRLLNLPENCKVFGRPFVGTVFLVGYNSEGEFVDFPFSIRILNEFKLLAPYNDDRGDTNE